MVRGKNPPVKEISNIHMCSLILMQLVTSQGAPRADDAPEVGAYLQETSRTVRGANPLPLYELPQVDGLHARYISRVY